MNLNRGGKHNSAELGRPGWPFWGGPTQSQGSLKREAGFGSESLLAWWATAWSLCYVHWHSEIIPPGPPPSSQLKCFLKRPLWVWGHQSGLLRLGGSLLPYVYSIVCMYFTRPLGLILHYLCFSFLYTLYFSDKGTPHWCDVPLFLPSVVSTLVPTSWQCVCFLWRPLPIKDEIKCCLSWSLLWFLIFTYSLFEIIILLST